MYVFFLKSKKFLTIEFALDTVKKPFEHVCSIIHKKMINLKNIFLRFLNYFYFLLPMNVYLMALTPRKFIPQKRGRYFMVNVSSRKYPNKENKNNFDLS